MTLWTAARSRVASVWAVLLAGPIVGTAYFFVVYLLAEASCAEGLDLVSATATRVVILAGAAASVAAFVAYGARARRLQQPADDAPAEQAENQRFMATTGLVVLGLFVLFVLFLAAPAIGTSLC